MKIPFVDLYAQYLSIKEDIDEAIKDTILHTSFIGGKVVTDFEKAFADYLGIGNVIACANGTDSLEIILKAWGIGKGDEVIVPAHSWISTSEAVGNVGATPVFVDVEEDYFTIDPTKIEAVINANTKAIIPVHLFGHPADMPAILRIAERYQLKVLEDCAQAHGASIHGKLIGTWGHAASFSFYPGKNLGAYGDAGCMATQNSALAEQLRMIANHGQKGKHNHLIEGRNSRLDGLQAAILKAKLPYLQKWTEARIKNALIYNEVLHSTDLQLPKVKEGYQHVFHLYVVKSPKRDALVKHLKENDIETAIHYPTPLPFLPCYESRIDFNKNAFDIALKSSKEIISLPMFAELTKTQIEYIAFSIKK